MRVAVNFDQPHRKKPYKFFICTAFVEKRSTLREFSFSAPEQSEARAKARASLVVSESADHSTTARDGDHEPYSSDQSNQTSSPNITPAASLSSVSSDDEEAPYHSDELNLECQLNSPLKLPEHLQSLAIASYHKIEKAMCGYKEKLKDYLLQDVRTAFDNQFRGCTPSNSLSSNQSAGQSIPSSQPALTYDAPGESRGKRPIRVSKRVTNNDDAEDDDDDDPERRKSSPRKRPKCQEERKYACHFFARDPLKHWPSQECKTGFPTVHRIKDHLYRLHHFEFYCGRCFEVFPDSQARDAHTRDIPIHMCEQRPSTVLEGMTGVQKKLIKSIRARAGAEDSERGKWIEMWEILFRGEEPRSPYYVDPATWMEQNSKELSSFTTYWQVHFERVMNPIVRTHLEDQALDLRTRDTVLRLILDAFKQGYDRMLSDFRLARTPESDPQETYDTTSGIESDPLRDTLFDSLRHENEEEYLFLPFYNSNHVETLEPIAGPSNAPYP